jgi:hypothetical protein
VVAQMQFYSVAIYFGVFGRSAIKISLLMSSALKDRDYVVRSAAEPTNWLQVNLQSCHSSFKGLGDKKFKLAPRTLVVVLP